MSASRPDEECRSCILVVEDQPQVAHVLSRLLCERGGHDALISDSAEDAMVYLWEHRPALVLIDVSLPGRNGIWLAGQIHEFWPDLPTLMLSGYAKRPYVEQSLAAGARGYVLKDDVPGILEGIHAALTGGTYVSPSLRVEPPASPDNPDLP